MATYLTSNIFSDINISGNCTIQGSMSSGNPITFKNALYNGDFRIAQRGTSFVNPSSQYVLDRWFIQGYGATGNGTVSQIQAGLQNFSNAFQLAITSTTGGNWFITQSLETRDIVRLQGQSVTVSYWYRIPTNFTAGWGSNLYWNTGTDAAIQNSIVGSPVSAGGVSLTNTTQWTYTSFQAFVPLTATQLAVMFSTFNNVVNGATIQITGVQLEKSTIATPFEVRPYATELALCQRYYQEVPNVNGGHFTGSGRTITTNSGTNTTLIGAITFPTPMRIAPTPASYGGGATNNITVSTASSGSQVNYSVAYSNVQASGNMSGTLYGFNVVNGGAVTTAGGSAQWIDMGWSGSLLGFTFNAEL
jgi:hypothetical protein